MGCVEARQYDYYRSLRIFEFIFLEISFPSSLMVYVYRRFLNNASSKMEPQVTYSYIYYDDLHMKM